MIPAPRTSTPDDGRFSVTRTSRKPSQRRYSAAAVRASCAVRMVTGRNGGRGPVRRLGLAGAGRELPRRGGTLGGRTGRAGAASAAGGTLFCGFADRDWDGGSAPGSAPDSVPGMERGPASGMDCGPAGGPACGLACGLDCGATGSRSNVPHPQPISGCGHSFDTPHAGQLTATHDPAHVRCLTCAGVPSRSSGNVTGTPQSHG
jgi:hypothetical protein